MEARTRKEDCYRETVSKNGEFSPRIEPEIARRLTRYCSLKNINKTRFVNDCVSTQLDTLEAQNLEMFSKEELIEMILANKQKEEQIALIKMV